MGHISIELKHLIQEIGKSFGDWLDDGVRDDESALAARPH